MPYARSRRRAPFLAGAAALAAALVAVTLPAGVLPAAARTPASAPAPPERVALAAQLEKAVTERSGYRHLRAFQRLTDAHGGTRASATPGHEAAARYVTRRLTAAGYRVRRQPFAFPDYLPEHESAVATGPARRELHPFVAQFSPSTPPGGLRARVAVVPGAGCAPEEYTQAHTRGRIALVRGGTCALTAKQDAAARAGTRALLMNIDAPGPDINLRHFLIPEDAGRIPSGLLTRRESEQLLADAATGTPVHLRLDLRGRRVTTRSFNLLADTPTGDPGRTIVVGAHLDGAREGPGIDDNASSAAMVLETALRLAPRFGQVRHRVRFAWWGAEELLLRGSEHYVAALGPAERRAHALNLNFETIGASNFARMVYDGDDSDRTGAGPGPPGSGTVEHAFTSYFAARGLPTVGLDLDGRSDFAPFLAAGIPAGGGAGGYNHIKTPEWQRLFGGTAGRFLDPCYHQPCDRIDQINRRFFGQYGNAIAYVTGHFAEDLTAIPRR